jgi:hypothetical protein
LYAPIKILLWFANKRYDMALHSKDNIEVLYKTVLEKIIESLHKIHDGDRLNVTMDDDRALNLMFHNCSSDNRMICDVPNWLFIHGRYLEEKE